jgi:drug/metabolite transporter (DMT)-like permease
MEAPGAFVTGASSSIHAGDQEGMVKVDKDQATGLGLVLLAILSLSIAPTLIKIGLAAEVGPIALLALRFLVAAIAFWIFFPLIRRSALSIDRRGLLSCAAVALANTTSLICFYLAAERIDASVAIMIFSLYPLVALLLLATRGESITRRTVLRLTLAGAGVYLLIGIGGKVDNGGLLLALGTAIAYAAHMVLAQWLLADYPPQTVALYTVTTIAVFMIGIWSFQPHSWQALSPSGWAVILVTGLVSTFVARLAMFAAIHRIGSGQVALMGPLEVLLGVAWTQIFLDERLSALQIIGGLFILISATLSARRLAR